MTTDADQAELTGIFIELGMHLAILAIPVFLLFAGVWVKRAKMRSAESWSSVSGRIVQAKVRAIESSTRSMAILSYAYFVKGYESGEYEQAFSKASDAHAFVRKMRDQEVLVRYHPWSPQISVVEKRSLEQIALTRPDE